MLTFTRITEMIFSIVLYGLASLTTDEDMLLAILDSDSDSDVQEFILISHYKGRPKRNNKTSSLA